MWAIQFFVYALIVFLLATLMGGTLIGYYFTKKAELEMTNLKRLSAAVQAAQEQKQEQK